jgi:two-component system, OmpR family, response regulator RegX3
MENTKILLVDDEPDILALLSKTLKSEGFCHILTASTGAEAIQICMEKQPDLIVLDVMLPDLEGYEVCRKLRPITESPIFFLAARTTDLDKLTGYSMGGDDYIEKPFNPLIIVAKIKVLLKRKHSLQKPFPEHLAIYEDDRIKVIEKTGQLFVKGREVACTAKEFKLLAFLCKNPYQIFSMGQLYHHVWGEESFGYENTVMVHIGQLRKKIEPCPRKPKYIITIRGLGYKFMGNNKVGSQ